MPAKQAPKKITLGVPTFSTVKTRRSRSASTQDEKNNKSAPAAATAGANGITSLGPDDEIVRILSTSKIAGLEPTYFVVSFITCSAHVVCLIFCVLETTQRQKVQGLSGQCCSLSVTDRWFQVDSATMQEYPDLLDEHGEKHGSSQDEQDNDDASDAALEDSSEDAEDMDPDDDDGDNFEEAPRRTKRLINKRAASRPKRAVKEKEVLEPTRRSERANRRQAAYTDETPDAERMDVDSSDNASDGEGEEEVETIEANSQKVSKKGAAAAKTANQPRTLNMTWSNDNDDETNEPISALEAHKPVCVS